MIQPLSADRITIDGVLSSPVFWQKEKVLRFLSEVSDRLEREELGAPIMNYLEQYREMIGGEDWKLKMSIVLQEDLRRFRTYGNKVGKAIFGTFWESVLFCIHSDSRQVSFPCIKLHELTLGLFF